MSVSVTWRERRGRWRGWGTFLVGVDILYLADLLSTYFIEAFTFLATCTTDPLLTHFLSKY